MILHRFCVWNVFWHVSGLLSDSGVALRLRVLPSHLRGWYHLHRYRRMHNSTVISAAWLWSW
ncbi:hypothetical protein KC19_VG273700 [Ceratodon purpureus]|uniref:Uncharacterized protein n=1 Tax=Ceratodon purpureus TaxID=3225 RepID=A0A8T0HU68_CERPU|nr:hypothetical protein KC19_VG273700 [Ceratodon purpureus]